MLAEVLVLALGLALLLGGGETVVRGSTALARALGVSPLAIGLTVVAFGTSAPELAVNVTAGLRGRGDICFGNIIGSNMANVGLIVGLTAILRPMLIQGVVIMREIPMMLLATAAAVVMGLDTSIGHGDDDVFVRSDGLLLLMFFLIFLYYTVGDFVRRQRNHNGLRNATLLASSEGEMESGAEAEPPLLRNLVITSLGLAALVGGAQLTVDAAVSLARAFGVPEVLIGLTLLSVGTSLPELVASLVATFRGHVELAIGNVVGSNIFNLLLVMGVTASLTPFGVPEGGAFDLALVSILSLMLLFVSLTRRRQIVRTEAGALLTLYLGYIAWRSGSLMGSG